MFSNPACNVRKTPHQHRNSIRYQFYDSSGNPEPPVIIMPGKDGVTKEDIRHFYSIEDSEVRYNIRAISPDAWMTKAEHAACQVKKEMWCEEYVRCFLNRFGYAPNPDDVEEKLNEAFPKNWCAYTEEIIWGGIGADNESYEDKSMLMYLLATRDEEETPNIDRLHEIIASWPERWQTIYYRVLINHESKKAVASSLGISDVRVGQIARNLENRIRNDDYLKNFYHAPSK